MTNMGVDKRFKQVISSCDHVSSVFQSQFSFWTQILLDSKVIFDKQKFPSWSSSNFFRDGEQVSRVLGILTAGGAGGNISSRESRLAAS